MSEEQPKMKKVEPQFMPSKALKDARELLDAAQASGHPRPILDFEGLRTFFDAMERDEREIFNLQMSLGRVAMEAEKARALLRELIDPPADNPTPTAPNRYVCANCYAEGETIPEVAHGETCPITRAKELIGG